MAADLATTSNGQALTGTIAPERVELLDTYAGGIADEAPRPDCLATISAGWREAGQNGKLGTPRASRDGKIILHDPRGRAPALKAALEATEYRRLLIAFPLDDPRAFLQQRFVNYSASALLAYGDGLSITVIRDGQHIRYAYGTEEYARAVSQCKVHVSLYFMLAEWAESGPAVVMGDGLGLYRLRTTSRHSLRNLAGTLDYVRRFTRGRLAGLPFELAIDYREVADPTGAKRTIPCWAITFRPPEGLRLDSRNFASLATQALEQGSALMLPAPRDETLEMAQVEALSDVQLAQLEAGGTCDEAYWRSRWHAIAEGTRFDDPRARAAFLDEFTQGQTDSLKEFLANATEAQAQALITDLEIALARNVVPVSAAAPLQQRSGAGVGFQGERLPDEDERSMRALFGHALKPQHEAPEAEYAADFEPDAAYDLDDLDQLDEETHAEQQGRIERENVGEDWVDPAAQQVMEEEAEADVDPHQQAADAAIAKLQTMAAEFLAEEGGKKRVAQVALVKAVKDTLRATLGLSTPEDQLTLLTAAFGCGLDRIDKAQARALLRFASEPGARSQAQVLVQVRGSQRSLLG